MSARRLACALYLGVVVPVVAAGFGWLLWGVVVR